MPFLVNKKALITY